MLTRLCALYSQFTLFHRRVEKLIDLFTTVDQFTVLAKHNLEGMDGLMNNFFSMVTDFKRKPYDLFDFAANQVTFTALKASLTCALSLLPPTPPLSLPTLSLSPATHLAASPPVHLVTSPSLSRSPIPRLRLNHLSRCPSDAVRLQIPASTQPLHLSLFSPLSPYLFSPRFDR